MNLFNSFQIVTLFAASPFIYNWLCSTGYTHWGILGLFWLAYGACYIYLVGCACLNQWKDVL